MTSGGDPLESTHRDHGSSRFPRETPRQARLSRVKSRKMRHRPAGSERNVPPLIAKHVSPPQQLLPSSETRRAHNKSSAVPGEGHGDTLSKATTPVSISKSSDLATHAPRRVTRSGHGRQHRQHASEQSPEDERVRRRNIQHALFAGQQRTHASPLFDPEGSFGAPIASRNPRRQCNDLGRNKCSTQQYVFQAVDVSSTRFADLVTWLLHIGATNGTAVGMSCSLARLHMATEHNKRVLYVVFHVDGESPGEPTTPHVDFETALRQTPLRLIIHAVAAQGSKHSTDGADAHQAPTTGCVEDLLIRVEPSHTCSCRNTRSATPASNAPLASDMEPPAWYWYHGSGTAPSPDGTGSAPDEAGIVQGGTKTPETTVALFPIQRRTGGSAMAVLRDALGRATRHQFDVAGLRLLFLSRTACAADASLQPLVRPGAGLPDDDVCDVVAVALRRVRAVDVWTTLVGPADAVLARRTHPGTLATAPLQRAYVFLPGDTVHRWCDWVALWRDAGFAVEGCGKVKVSPQEATALSMPPALFHKGTDHASSERRTETSDVPDAPATLPQQAQYCMAWVIAKENAVRFAQILLTQADAVHLRVSAFAVSPCTEHARAVLATAHDLPSPSVVARRLSEPVSARVLPCWPDDVPHGVVVAMPTACVDAVPTWLHPLLHDAAWASDEAGSSGGGSDYRVQTGGPLRVVGMKWLVDVRAHQAKELTPFEVGDAEYKASVAAIGASRLLLVTLHGWNAHARVRQAIAQGPAHARVLLTPQPRVLWRQLSAFFLERDVALPMNLNGAMLPAMDLSLRPTFLNLACRQPLVSTLSLVKPGCSAAGLVRILQAVHRAKLAIVHVRYVRSFSMRAYCLSVLCVPFRLSPSVSGSVRGNWRGCPAATLSLLLCSVLRDGSGLVVPCLSFLHQRSKTPMHRNRCVLCFCCKHVNASNSTNGSPCRCSCCTTCSNLWTLCSFANSDTVHSVAPSCSV
eukprot:m.1278365 g.1278365  ORF g.1278365 m.1278365 type:complete len:974 (+) comp24764_c0_seq62:1124-4045(+)